MNSLTQSQKAERMEKMLMLYLGGHNLEMIGGEFQITRERVRQILTQFPVYHEHLEGGNNMRNPAKVIKCLTCGKEFKQKTQKKKFCSVECFKKNTDLKYFKMEEKKCSKCGIIKPKSEFYLQHDNKARGFITADCRKCHMKLTKDWVKRHPEEAKVIQRRAEKTYEERHKKFCKNCGNPLCFSPKAKTGLCRKCYLAKSFNGTPN